ncbi:MAG: CARDB domain-containing protein [Caldisericota bacterium]|nr:CARDB domain-containing protein [Caldisericota bacterium]
MKRIKRFIVPFVIVSLIISASAGVFTISGKEENISLSTFYDFVQNADKAVWQSGAGYLQFPGSNSDSKGFALWQTNSYMEDNIKYAKILETHPEWKANGYIMGTYPNLTVPTGAKLSLKIGFLKGATGTDGVIYRVLFNYPGQPINIFEKYKSYTGKVETETIDLSKYQGKNGNFILYVSAGGKNSAQDWAGWAEAKILYTKKYPDLVITDLWNKGGVIHYKIKNIGDAPTTPKTAISFKNSLYLNDKSISQDTITKILNPNEEIEKSFSSYSYQPPQGTHTLKVCADTSQSINENNEGNNCLTKTISPGGIKVDTECKDVKIEIYNSSEKLVISGYSNETNTYSTGLMLAPDNYRVVPSKENCTFTPLYKLVNVVSNQVANVTFQCSCKKADLLITEITRLKTGGTIHYKVKNQGSIGTESYFYNALYINEKFIIKDYVKVYIKAGEELSREFKYSYTPTSPKDTIKVCADSDKNIEEKNEENNCLEVTWYTEEKLPDLIIDEIKCDMENSRISYVIKNIGEETAKGGHSTTLFVEGKEITHSLVSADLNPGMYCVVSIPFKEKV